MATKILFQRGMIELKENIGDHVTEALNGLQTAVYEIRDSKDYVLTEKVEALHYIANKGRGNIASIASKALDEVLKLLVPENAGKAYKPVGPEYKQV